MIFHHTSSFVKTWLLKQPHVKEESITDWLLLKISESSPEIFYRAFSRHEESINGTDWEWWVLTTDFTRTSSFNAYRFCVQAKKLTHSGDNFPRLNYSNSNGLQIDLLINHARSYHAFPLYMYYSTSEPNIEEQIKNLTPLSKKFFEWCVDCPNGCFLSCAYDVYKLLYSSTRKKLTDIDLLNYSIKLSLLDLLFQRPISDIENKLSRFNQYIVDHNDIEAGDKERFDQIYQTPGTYGIKHFGKGIPGYLSLFVERHTQNMDWFETEMRRELPDVGGIGVIDLRRK